MSKQRGFTLLEMVVATLIMGIAVVGLLSGISGATRNASRLRDYDRVVQLAQVRMNELLADQKLPRNVVMQGTFAPSLTGGLECGWAAVLTEYEKAPVMAPGQLALEQIRVDIWWMVGGQKRTMSLECLRKKVMREQDL